VSGASATATIWIEWADRWAGAKEYEARLSVDQVVEILFAPSGSRIRIDITDDGVTVAIVQEQGIA
jgi:hypothetical protein